MINICDDFRLNYTIRKLYKYDIQYKRNGYIFNFDNFFMIYQGINWKLIFDKFYLYIEHNKTMIYFVRLCVDTFQKYKMLKKINLCGDMCKVIGNIMIDLWF